MRHQVICISSISKLFVTQTFSTTLSNIELWKFKQTRNLADYNLFGGLRVNDISKFLPKVLEGDEACNLYSTVIVWSGAPMSITPSLPGQFCACANVCLVPPCAWHNFSFGITSIRVSNSFDLNQTQIYSASHLDLRWCLCYYS